MRALPPLGELMDEFPNRRFALGQRMTQRGGPFRETEPANTIRED